MAEQNDASSENDKAVEELKKSAEVKDREIAELKKSRRWKTIKSNSSYYDPRTSSSINLSV